MKKVLVVGLGEVGFPLYEIIKESGKFKVYGYDMNNKKRQQLNQPWTLPKQFDIVHICIPCTDGVEFCEIVLEYVLNYKPKLLIINSTVGPYTTSTIAKYADCLVVHSPIRGKHNTMKRDIKSYIKYIGPVNNDAAIAAREHFEEIGLKVRVLNKSVDSELAKLFETSYTALQIAAWQEMHRIALSFNADIDGVADMIDDVRSKGHVQVGPIWFPDVIRGHCLIPNLKLLIECSDSKLFNQAIKSNEKREMELKNYPPATKEVEEGIKKLKQRFKKNTKRFEGETTNDD